MERHSEEILFRNKKKTLQLSWKCVRGATNDKSLEEHLFLIPRAIYRVNRIAHFLLYPVRGFCSSGRRSSKQLNVCSLYLP